MSKHNWMYLVYGTKDNDSDIELPKPKGKSIQITGCEDASLGTCKVTGKSTTGFIILVHLNHQI